MKWSKPQSDALRGVFDALRKAKIEWMVLRNHEGLPEVNRSKDVDMGMAKSDFDAAHALISTAVGEVGFLHALVEEFQYVRCLTYFGEFDNGPQSIKIDLLDGFVFRGAQIFNFPDLNERGRTENGIRIPHKTDDAVMLWMKPLLTGGFVKSKYVDDILAGASQDPSGFRSVLDRVFSGKLADRAWSKIKLGDLKGTIALQGELRRSAWLTALLARPVETLWNFTHHCISEVRRRSVRNPATFIAVLGPDGVGKTTFINSLATKLADLQAKDIDAITIHHFRPNILPNINRLLTGREEKVEAFHNPHRAPPANWLSSTVRLTYYWFDYVLGYWISIRARCMAGATVIFDRYYYDFLVDPRRSRLSGIKILASIILKFTPEPDYVFILEADPDVVFERKQELSAEEIARQIGGYRTLAREHADRFTILDAAQPPEAVTADALVALIRHCYSKSI